MPNFIIYGLGISGVGAIKLVLKHFNDPNTEVFATDDNPKSILNAQQKIADYDSNLVKRVKFITPQETLNHNQNLVVILSPGIPIDMPTPNKILQTLRENGAEIICDIELFYRINSSKYDFIGITGTNGKSTTTALVGHILSNIDGVSYGIGGNIGISCFELDNLPEGSVCVFEMSSYQLDLISKARFNTSCLLNVTKDHIDRHGTIENYTKSKLRIFSNSNEDDYAIIGVDSKISEEVFEKIQSITKALPVPISSIREVDNGVFVKNQTLINKIDKEYSINLDGAILKGDHNYQNIACAFALVYCYFRQKNAISTSIINSIIDSIKSFPGLKHRMQFIGKINNISFINDSKATNAESTENALAAYNDIYWILGGEPKEGGIEILKKYFKKVTKAYLIGKATDDFAKTLLSQNINFEKCGNLKIAFEKAYFDASSDSSSKEKNILLSPACASFDQWKNFEERGEFFINMANSALKS